MSKIEIISVNKPYFKKAAELLGPILYDMLIKKRLDRLDEILGSKQEESSQFDSGDSVA